VRLRVFEASAKRWQIQPEISVPISTMPSTGMHFLLHMPPLCLQPARQKSDKTHECVAIGVPCTFPTKNHHIIRLSFEFENAILAFYLQMGVAGFGATSMQHAFGVF
jgi:hypothetical protein